MRRVGSHTGTHGGHQDPVGKGVASLDGPNFNAAKRAHVRTEMLFLIDLSMPQLLFLNNCVMPGEIVCASQASAVHQLLPVITVWSILELT